MRRGPAPLWCDWRPAVANILGGWNRAWLRLVIETPGLQGAELESELGLAGT